MKFFGYCTWGKNKDYNLPPSTQLILEKREFTIFSPRGYITSLYSRLLLEVFRYLQDYRKSSVIVRPVRLQLQLEYFLCLLIPQLLPLLGVIKTLPEGPFGSVKTPSLLSTVGF